MNMKRGLLNIVIITLIFISGPIASQELNLGFEAGIGKFKMNDLKKINEDVLRSLPFGARVTHDYPAYFHYKPSLLLSVNEIINIGAVWSFHSTGSRVSRTDYSGEYLFDSKIRTSSPGILIDFCYPAEKLRVSLRNEIGINFSKLNLREYLQIYNESDSDEASFISSNYYYNPAVMITYPLLFFRVGLNAGYLYDIKKGSFSNTENKNIILEMSDGEEANADWTGFRFGLFLTYDLLRKKKQSQD
jgi:hypothetical protein